MAFLGALEALGRRTYGGWDELRVEWEGDPMPARFRAWSARLRKRWPDAEARSGDPDWCVEAFLYHLRLGLHYGYPDCCVLAYAAAAPHLPVLRERRVGFGEYVPCEACLERFLADYQGSEDPAGPFPVAPA